MILTVCLNPALDVTYTVPSLHPGGSHRVQTVRRRAGGKGINVASVLHQEQIDTTVLAPVGGTVGTDLRSGLETAGIPHHLVPIEASTRQTVTVVSDEGATVLNEPGPTLCADEWSAITKEFGSVARSAQVVTLSGSLPPGAPPDAYAQLILLAHDAGTPTILDCDGDALIAALHARPDILKINHHEAAAGTETATSCDDGVFAAAEQLHALGAAEVVITRGAQGAAARTDAGRFVARAAGSVTGNPTGAGDAFTAGLAGSLAAGLTWPERLRRASGWAAGAVATPSAGELDVAVAADHQARTTIEEISTP